MHSLLTALVAAGALLVGVSSQAKASIILDGDFTNPSGGPDFATYGPCGGVCIAGPMGPWAIVAGSVDLGSVDLIGGYWQAPPGGGGSVDLDGHSPGAISQSFSAAPGKYQLSFYLSVNPDGTSSPTRTVLVSVGDQSSVPFTFVGSSFRFQPMNYIHEILNFTVAGPTSLKFASADSSGFFGPVIGNVAVSSTPLPSTWAMLLIGLAGLGFVASRRTKSGSAAIAAA
jgi:MYXO-CTERM domain-containing protein